VSRPLLLDLFCGAGGAAAGYHGAGFDVIGVDIRPQPHYPFSFIQADAMTMAYKFSRFDAIHASPPCQDHVRGGLQNPTGTGWMLAGIRRQLENWGGPWVLENVPGAPMRADFALCGSQFGLLVRRHRWFETCPQLFGLLPPCDHTKPVVGVYGHLHGKAGAWPGMLPSTIETWRAGMGIGWMTADELRQAIPPAYSEYIGGQLLKHLTEVSSQKNVSRPAPGSGWDGTGHAAYRAQAAEQSGSTFLAGHGTRVTWAVTA